MRHNEEVAQVKNFLSRPGIAAACVSVFAVLGLTLAGCAPAASESREAKWAGTLDVEVCFTNELASERVQVSTTWDGSGTLWQTSLKPGQTRCSHSNNSAKLQGYFQVLDSPEEFYYDFWNAPYDYPGGRLIRRPVGSSAELGQGMCQNFSAGESLFLDYGTARLFVERQTDSEYKRFRVVLMPSEAKSALTWC